MSVSSLPPAAAAPVRMMSGRLAVALMFVFGVAATGTLWTYWYYHTAPFIPLQVAIADEFPRSAPRVDGGQRRIHSGTPTHLWVIMRVEFHPRHDSGQAEKTVARVQQLVHQTLDISEYEQLTVRLFQGEEEQMLHHVDFEISLQSATAPARSAGE